MGCPTTLGDCYFQAQDEMLSYRSQSASERGFFKLSFLRKNALQFCIDPSNWGGLAKFTLGSFSCPVITGMCAEADFHVTLRYWQKSLCI